MHYLFYIDDLINIPDNSMQTALETYTQNVTTTTDPVALSLWTHELLVIAQYHRQSGNLSTAMQYVRLTSRAVNRLASLGDVEAATAHGNRLHEEMKSLDNAMKEAINELELEAMEPMDGNWAA